MIIKIYKDKKLCEEFCVASYYINYEDKYFNYWDGHPSTDYETVLYDHIDSTGDTISVWK